MLRPGALQKSCDHVSHRRNKRATRQTHLAKPPIIVLVEYNIGTNLNLTVHHEKEPESPGDAVTKHDSALLRVFQLGSTTTPMPNASQHSCYGIQLARWCHINDLVLFYEREVDIGCVYERDTPKERREHAEEQPSREQQISRAILVDPGDVPFLPEENDVGAAGARRLRVVRVDKEIYRPRPRQGYLWSRAQSFPVH